MLLLKELEKLKLIIRLSKQAFGAYKLQIIILIVLGFVNGLLGGVGINAIIPLFSFIINGEAEEKDIISQYIEKFFSLLDINFTLKYLLIFIIFLFILKAAILVLSSYISIRITSGYKEKTRINLLNKIFKSSWPHLIKQKLGHLEVVLMKNIENSTGLLSQISIAIMTITSLVSYSAIALNISLNITLITFTFGALLFISFKPIVKKIRKISYESEKIDRDIAHYINENIIGMKTVKVMSVADKVFDIGRNYFKKITAINIRSFVLNIFTGSLMEPISIIFIAAVFAFSYKTSNFNFAALITVIYLIKQIFIYINQMHQMLLGMNSTIPYVKSVLDYETQAIQNEEVNCGTGNFIFNKSLIFKNVDFSYSKSSVLKNVNFEINKGEMVGLIGPSGAGKTTIVDLILRLFDPANGKILLDGKNIKEINLVKWRNNIGYVSQDIFLMNDTIANNIKFFDNSITDKEVQSAAEMANMYEFIMNCPNGFDTLVGERGARLSAGQKQRIIIARVLARKPQLLILDEATSALDNESEIKIKHAINNLKGKITVLAIAHRLSTIVNSDKLIALVDGKIVEQGEPDELFKDKNSYFSKMYNIGS